MTRPVDGLLALDRATAELLDELRRGGTILQCAGSYHLLPTCRPVPRYRVDLLRAGGPVARSLQGCLVPAGDRLPGFDPAHSQTWRWRCGR